MKILAVIPARAGSKGIPNKNIRIIAGHPLIYYAINNAKKSRYITDIVVSTDSPEVKIIAEQMDVNVKIRDSSLCADDVTLDAVIYDAVIYDAIPNERWDYIVTMQPTSPTLSADKLDEAIEYAINTERDTVISAVNRPHLAWIEDKKGKIPAYKERLNRQYLPPYYVETGAFVISKYECVKPDSRIGKKVDVFELPEEQAIDIDNFTDLEIAKAILDRKNVAIYVNGNNKRGMGHVYRVLELADEFDVKPDIFYDKNQTDVSVFGNTKHNLVPVDGIEELYGYCKRNNYKIFINDIFSTTIDYMIALRKVLPKARIINFEDDGEGIYKADAVINALYENSNIPNVYASEKYYISNKLFLFYKPVDIKKEVKKVFISFGGADPQNYSERLLKIISNENYNNYEFVMVLGRAKENVAQLINKYKKNNIEILYDVSNMPELMGNCDIAVTSRGRTGYELAMLGIPTIAMSQNSREEKHGFISEENGFTYIGLNPADEVIEANLELYTTLSKEVRSEMQNKMLKHDLRNGRKRVMDIING